MFAIDIKMLSTFGPSMIGLKEGGAAELPRSPHRPGLW